MEEKEQIRPRKLKGSLKSFFIFYTVLIALVHLYYNSFGLIDVMHKNLLHLTSMMSIVFLIQPAGKKSPKDKPSIFDWLLFALAIGCGIYFWFAYYPLVLSMMQPTNGNLIYGAIMALLIIEASRRVVGLPLTIISTSFLLYTYVGPYMPGFFIHQGFTLRRILVRMTMTSEGILGIPVMVSASYVFMFIIFASFLRVSNASKFFNDFATALTGRARGGPAKIAIFASALTGTINGSSQANVVTTGSFTIPLMKSVGYKPHFAGAVEAIASVGGILTPPIMGAAAFIMTSFLGLPYGRIIMAAFTPAILYYFTLYHMVDLRAAKMELKGIEKEALPSLKEVMKEGGHMMVPLFVIFYFLLRGFSPVMAALIGILSIIAVSFVRPSTRLSLRDIIDALSDATREGASIAIICGIVGFIIGAVGMTGIGQVIGHNIVRLAGGRIWLTAVFSMVTAIILGMGLPGPACYIITATIAAPALMLLGIPMLSAHFFAFYYGTMSAVIPPVALTSYTAGAIAGANPNRVAITGFLLGSAGFLLPYMFIYNPVILMFDFTWGNYLFSVLSLALGLYFISGVIIGVLKTPLASWERLLLGLIGFVLVVPVFHIRLAGLIVGCLVYAFYHLKAQKLAEPFAV